jgi:hypothetical protein
MKHNAKLDEMRATLEKIGDSHINWQKRHKKSESKTAQSSCSLSSLTPTTKRVVQKKFTRSVRALTKMIKSTESQRMDSTAAATAEPPAPSANSSTKVVEISIEDPSSSAEVKKFLDGVLHEENNTISSASQDKLRASYPEVRSSNGGQQGPDHPAQTEEFVGQWEIHLYNNAPGNLVLKQDNGSMDGDRALPDDWPHRDSLKPESLNANSVQPGLYSKTSNHHTCNEIQSLCLMHSNTSSGPTSYLDRRRKGRSANERFLVDVCGHIYVDMLPEVRSSRLISVETSMNTNEMFCDDCSQLVPQIDRILRMEKCEREVGTGSAGESIRCAFRSQLQYVDCGEWDTPDWTSDLFHAYKPMPCVHCLGYIFLDRDRLEDPIQGDRYAFGYICQFCYKATWVIPATKDAVDGNTEVQEEILSSFDSLPCFYCEDRVATRNDADSRVPNYPRLYLANSCEGLVYLCNDCEKYTILTKGIIPELDTIAARWKVEDEEARERWERGGSSCLLM